MCGIISAVSCKDVTAMLIDGLSRLEYRGYDSCGIAIYGKKNLRRVRSMKRVSDLSKQIIENSLYGCIGLAHTRWATHGMPSTHNAHPHFSNLDSGKPRIALVHNGIIENYDELRVKLQKSGYAFESQTDTEVLVHLINYNYDGDIFRTVQKVTKLLTGTYAIAVFCTDEPYRIIGSCKGAPLVLGIGDNENFLASDVLAISGKANEVIYLDDGDIVDIQCNNFLILDSYNVPVNRKKYPKSSFMGVVELGAYRHYMQKEIFEQPRAVADTLQEVNALSEDIFGIESIEIFRDIDSVLIIACGTSYYAGMTAKYWIESIAKIRVSVEIASEYRYRDSVVNPKSLVLVISQSGETSDTLSALKHSISLGMNYNMAICNSPTSAIVRECKLCYITRAGIEIGVASTKAFTTQLSVLFLLSITLAKNRSILSKDNEITFLKALRHLPAALSSVLDLEPLVISWANHFANKENALFLGRGMHYPIALEGALKMKEISYIHAEAYPAGELKHGPLALVTDNMPVVVVAPKDILLEKLKSNMQEVQARGGKLYVFADADSKINDDSIHLIRMPENYGMLSPILHTIPLQLLAYHTACIRGTDVDKPRNLAKSVTVE
ncbi:isomerizing glucosamine--fructose-6-phosphate aminotransferase [Candidatus Kinetoplastibacterium oncopeltii TCC290E]|uniref:Glutamine--fructose-6-phosphate aminotransferase [isomerizing] n=1 Tax=Candidatus Kinetoplastidibacterium stringomonadis TCC290E TaxID=1208920 RepID=M1L625_9PROT|nr:glutamine--fructose-6-phosphate transaminase (isomerizing) [Candidatus Kinetoplastibacterium oncopeltii]AGF48068.1 isomerizing glucosamine--fructose-6-phosphate aminotransferase [Candidatus Kinetoplastibacterium oncopeltii TCC290E]